MGILSWVIALVLGIPGAYAFVRLLGSILIPVPFAFNILSLLWMLLFIIIIASLACIGPVWGATRIKIAQTLHYE